MLASEHANSSHFRRGEHRWYEKTCERCFGKFTSASGSRKACPDCCKCEQCGKQMPNGTDRFCGISCAGKWRYQHDDKVRQVILNGRISIEARHKRGISTGNYWRGRPRYNLRGDKNPNWRGGTYKTSRHVLMGRVEYKNWRLAVFTRDDYTCQICGVRGGVLNADHILPLYTNPELVLDVDNGRTVCVGCHKTLPTTGHKVKTQYKAGRKKYGSKRMAEMAAAGRKRG